MVHSKTPFVLAFALLPLACAEPAVTFYKQVLPVLQKHCQSCHRAGEAGPMALTSFAEARPWAKSIRQAVLEKRMPPWHADPDVGVFANARVLSADETRILTAWAEQGATEGNRVDAPPPRHFVDGWNIGEPDAIFEMPEFAVPASGTVDYQHFVVPTNLKEDRWVDAIEIRPGNRRLLHHALVYLRPQGSTWLKAAQPGRPFAAPLMWALGMSPREEFLAAYGPGSVPDCYPSGQAKLIPAGADLIFQTHYTPDGKPGTDRCRIGFKFAKEPPRERIVTVPIQNAALRIPAGASDHRQDARFVLQTDAKIVSFTPHMHLRGKAFEYRLMLPGADPQPLLRVPHYSFQWQPTYYLERQIPVPEGARIECTARYDNSANNPFNPDPNREVHWGDQSWDEMMIGFVHVAIDAKLGPDAIYRKPR